MRKNTKRPVEHTVRYTTLGRGTVFKGNLEFKSDLKIKGAFEGEIESSGSIYIECDATVKADIKVASVVIGGTVHGNITATNKVEMLDTGRVYGNIKTSRLRIADGVVFEGKCEMIKDPEGVDIFSTTVSKLKKTVESI